MDAEGLTQRVLAERLGVSQGHLSKVLRGKYKRDSKVVRALQGCLDDLDRGSTGTLAQAERELLAAARAVADGSPQMMRLMMQFMQIAAELRTAPAGRTRRKHKSR